MPGRLTLDQLQEAIDESTSRIFVSPRTYVNIMETPRPDNSEPLPEISVDYRVPDDQMWTVTVNDNGNTTYSSSNGSGVTFDNGIGDTHTTPRIGTYTVPTSGRYRWAGSFGSISYDEPGYIAPAERLQTTGEAVVFYATADRHLRVGKIYPIYQGTYDGEKYILDERSIGRHVTALKGSYRIKKPVKSKLPEGL